MLSILIPTYNQDITKLATELHRQAMEQHVDFEVIVMEDGSSMFVEENKISTEEIQELIRQVESRKSTPNEQLPVVPDQINPEFKPAVFDFQRLDA